MKPVTVVMKRLTNALSKNEVFQVHKAVNTLQVKVGDKIEEWTLYNAWAKGFDGGELDSSGDDVMEITTEIVYNYAVLQY